MQGYKQAELGFSKDSPYDYDGAYKETPAETKVIPATADGNTPAQVATGPVAGPLPGSRPVIATPEKKPEAAFDEESYHKAIEMLERVPHILKPEWELALRQYREILKESFLGKATTAPEEFDTIMTPHIARVEKILATGTERKNEIQQHMVKAWELARLHTKKRVEAAKKTAELFNSPEAAGKVKAFPINDLIACLAPMNLRQFKEFEGTLAPEVIKVIKSRIPELFQANLKLKIGNIKNIVTHLMAARNQTEPLKRILEKIPDITRKDEKSAAAAKASLSTHYHTTLLSHGNNSAVATRINQATKAITASLHAKGKTLEDYHRELIIAAFKNGQAVTAEIIDRIANAPRPRFAAKAYIKAIEQLKKMQQGQEPTSEQLKQLKSHFENIDDAKVTDKLIESMVNNIPKKSLKFTSASFSLGKPRSTITKMPVPMPPGNGNKANTAEQHATTAEPMTEMPAVASSPLISVSPQRESSAAMTIPSSDKNIQHPHSLDLNPSQSAIREYPSTAQPNQQGSSESKSSSPEQQALQLFNVLKAAATIARNNAQGDLNAIVIEKTAIAIKNMIIALGGEQNPKVIEKALEQHIDKDPETGKLLNPKNPASGIATLKGKLAGYWLMAQSNAARQKPPAADTSPQLQANAFAPQTPPLISNSRNQEAPSTVGNAGDPQPQRLTPPAPGRKRSGSIGSAPKAQSEVLQLRRKSI